MLDPTVPTQVSGSPADRPSLIPDYFWPQPDDRLAPGWLLDWLDRIDAHPITAGVIGAVALGLLGLAVVVVRMVIRDATALARYTIGSTAGLARRWAAGRTAEDILTIVAASIATGVSAQGMWRFFGDVLGLSGPLRLLLFAFIEVAVITSAVRAKRSMREKHSAGIDGIAVWALTCLSAVLSAMDARSVAEAIFRLAAPLVAAWLWERGMALERRRATGLKGIHWRITPERILVRLGLADTTDRTAEQVDVQRRLTRVALAADNAHQLREADASERKQRKAYARFRSAFVAATRHTSLVSDPELQKDLLAKRAALRSMEQLLDVRPASAWTEADDPAGFGALAAETRQLNEALASRHATRSDMANLTMLLADLTRQHLVPAGDVRPVEDTQPVEPLFLPREQTRQASGDASSAAPGSAPSAPTSAGDAPAAPESATAPAPTDDAGSAPTPDPAPAPGSATARMYDHWKKEVAKGRRPTGVELGTVGGCGEQYARKKRRAWEETLTPEQRARLGLQGAAA